MTAPVLSCAEIRAAGSRRRRGESRDRGGWREMRRGFARRRSGVDEVAKMEMAPPQAPAEFAQDLATDAGRDDRRVPAQSTVR
jgi:hypothetical protein